MWLMTSFGILMPAVRPADTIDPGDARTMQIRTRRAKDLDILRREYMPDLGPTISTPDMDYNYRAYCTPEQFQEAAARMIAAIDYEKFKPTTEDLYKDKLLHAVYNAIWSTVCRLGSPGGIYGPRTGSNPYGYETRYSKRRGGKKSKVQNRQFSTFNSEWDSTFPAPRTREYYERVFGVNDRYISSILDEPSDDEDLSDTLEEYDLHGMLTFEPGELTDEEIFSMERPTRSRKSRKRAKRRTARGVQLGSIE